MAIIHPRQPLTIEGESFYRQFFRALDAFRQNLGNFILSDAAIVWNGNPIGGRDAFLAMYSSMPETQHDVSEFNVHPAPNSNDNMMNMVLTASGKVKFGDERGKNIYGFSSTFVLKRDLHANVTAIQSMSYRLNHKPEGATLVA
jgi:hypothetical protein